VDTEERMKALSEPVERALTMLSRKEREIIEKRYLADEPLTDYLIWPELGMSERQYYRVKGSAFYKLAYMLRWLPG
jgi:ArpU family phage transcriptional regulator